jgi:hypothetical protein
VDDEVLRVAVRLETGPDVDAEEADTLARRLRAELGDLDADISTVAADGELPPGAKGVDPVTVGSLMVAFSASGGVFTGLVETLKDWLGRQNGKHRIKVTIDGDTLELERAAPAERQQLIDAYVRKHGG